MSLLFLLLVMGIVAVVCHVGIRSFMLACLTSALLSTLLLQVIAYTELGYLDPFFIISLVTVAFYAFVISLPVGWATRAVRRRYTTESTPTPAPHPDTPEKDPGTSG